MKNLYIRDQYVDLVVRDLARFRDIVTENIPMNNNISRIHRGVDNEIRFRVFNQDRKPVDVSHQSVVVQLRHPVTGDVLLTKSLWQGPRKGMLILKITEAEVSRLEPGQYNMIVVGQQSLVPGADQDIYSQPFYTDLSDRITAMVEVTASADPGPQPSAIIEPGDWRLLQAQEGVTMVDEYRTSAISADRVRKHLNGMHTLAVFTSGFTGTLQVMASLDLQPPEDIRRWFPVDLSTGTNILEFDNFTGNISFTFTANFMWLTFVKRPGARLQDHTSVTQVTDSPVTATVEFGPGLSVINNPGNLGAVGSVLTSNKLMIREETSARAESPITLTDGLVDAINLDLVGGGVSNTANALNQWDQSDLDTALTVIGQLVRPLVNGEPVTNLEWDRLAEAMPNLAGSNPHPTAAATLANNLNWIHAEISDWSQIRFPSIITTEWRLRLADLARELVSALASDLAGGVSATQQFASELWRDGRPLIPDSWRGPVTVTLERTLLLVGDLIRNQPANNIPAVGAEPPPAARVPSQDLVGENFATVGSITGSSVDSDLLDNAIPGLIGSLPAPLDDIFQSLLISVAQDLITGGSGHTQRTTRLRLLSGHGEHIPLGQAGGDALIGLLDDLNNLAWSDPSVGAHAAALLSASSWVLIAPWLNRFTDNLLTAVNTGGWTEAADLLDLNQDYLVSEFNAAMELDVTLESGLRELLTGFSEDLRNGGWLGSVNGITTGIYRWGTGGFGPQSESSFENLQDNLMALVRDNPSALTTLGPVAPSPSTSGPVAGSNTIDGLILALIHDAVQEVVRFESEISRTNNWTNDLMLTYPVTFSEPDDREELLMLREDTLDAVELDVLPLGVADDVIHMFADFLDSVSLEQSLNEIQDGWRGPRWPDAERDILRIWATMTWLSGNLNDFVDRTIATLEPVLRVLCGAESGIDVEGPAQYLVNSRFLNEQAVSWAAVHHPNVAPDRVREFTSRLAEALALDAALYGAVRRGEFVTWLWSQSPGENLLWQRSLMGYLASVSPSVMYGNDITVTQNLESQITYSGLVDGPALDEWITVLQEAVTQHSLPLRIPSLIINGGFSYAALAISQNRETVIQDAAVNTGASQSMLDDITNNLLLDLNSGGVSAWTTLAVSVSSLKLRVTQRQELRAGIEQIRASFVSLGNAAQSGGGAVIDLMFSELIRVVDQEPPQASPLLATDEGRAERLLELNRDFIVAETQASNPGEDPSRVEALTLLVLDYIQSQLIAPSHSAQTDFEDNFFRNGAILPGGTSQSVVTFVSHISQLVIQQSSISNLQSLITVVTDPDLTVTSNGWNEIEGFIDNIVDTLLDIVIENGTTQPRFTLPFRRQVITVDTQADVAGAEWVASSLTSALIGVITNPPFNQAFPAGTVPDSDLGVDVVESMVRQALNVILNFNTNAQPLLGLFAGINNPGGFDSASDTILSNQLTLVSDALSGVPSSFRVRASSELNRVVTGLAGGTPELTGDLRFGGFTQMLALTSEWFGNSEPLFDQDQREWLADAINSLAVGMHTVLTNHPDRVVVISTVNVLLGALVNNLRYPPLPEDSTGEILKIALR